MQNFKNLRHLVLDAETHYANKYSLKVMNTMEYVNHPEFNLQGFAWKILDSEDAAEWVSEDDVEDFLNEQDWNETAIICHNTPFDAYILSQLYNIKPAFHYDTQSMSRGRFPGKLHSLEALVERLFPDDLAIRKGKELILAKGTKHLTGELDKVIGGYACNDVEITAHAFKWFINNGYPEDELKIIDLTTRMFTQPTLYMNKERMTSVKNTALKTSKDKITASGISAEILRSNDQFSDYVQNTLKLTVPTKMGKNGIIPAFGKNDISFQKLRADHPEYKDIWDARLASKSRLDVTRSTRLLNGTNKDGTISMPLKYYAAHTGRFGGTEKINPQNMKRGSEMRKCLVAGDGHVVVVADKSQIEARLTAWLAGCDKLVQAFRDERDIYSEFSTNSVYHRPITKADTVERFVGKTCILGLGFGVGGVKLQATLESGSQGPVVIITELEAKRIVRAYRVEFHEIPALWKRLEEMAVWLQNPDYYGMKYGPLTAGKEEWILPNGMSVQYPQIEGLSFYDARYKMRKTIWGGVFTENLIQALARVNICDDMLMIQEFIYANQLDAAIALQVHDEVIMTCREDQAEGLYKNVLRIMATPPTWAPDIPLKAEGGIAKEYSK